MQATAAPLRNGQFSVASYMSATRTPLRYGVLTNPNPANDKALLYLPGLGGSVKGALRFLDTLLPNYARIYAPDIRSFGLNSDQDPLGAMPALFDDLAAFHQHLRQDADHPAWDLCGISLGGLLATQLVTEYPQWQPRGYQRLVLLVPAFAAHASKFPLRYTLGNITRRLMTGPAYRATLPYGIEALTQNPDVLADPQYAEQPRLQIPFDFLWSVKLLGARAMRNMKRLTLPTLMVVADCDVVCDPGAMRKAFANIPADTPHELLAYPNLFHDVLLEAEAAEIAEKTLAWLQQELP